MESDHSAPPSSSNQFGTAVCSREPWFVAGRRFNSDAMDVLRRCLRYNSTERPSAKKMLALRYFTEDSNRSETRSVEGATDLS